MMDSEDSNINRITDFEHGVKAMEDDDFDTAIESFQKCMKILSSEGHGLTSELFPKCLQNISSCYNKKHDMENALSFKKFEKLYYETVLLHNGLDELLLKDRPDATDEEDSTRDRGDGSSDTSGNSIQASSNANDPNGEENAESQTEKRASEYEQLAKLCLQQECIGLSLEYSGKATILYRHQFGDDHEKTRKSFDFFTSVYAEAGKRQYSDSMQQLDLENNTDVLSPAAVEETLLRHRKNVSRGSEQSQGENRKETSSIQRHRSILKRTKSDEDLQQRNGDAANNERRVTFADPLPQMVRLREDDESDNSTTNLLLFFLVCVLIILLSLLISAVFCHMNPKIGACVEFRREFTYYYNKFRYLYRSFSR